jgi:hypothetical protein
MAENEIDIRELLSRRADLSAFLVHFTRDLDTGTAKRNLERILRKHTLEARNPFGPAREMRSRKDKESQKCVSFTEVPLMYVHNLTGTIPKRRISLSPYGLAFTKMMARGKGANPVWYVDMTPGHEFLMNSINRIIEEQKGVAFRETAIAKICPFIEQMGSGTRNSDGRRYQKEFWWEREWRHVGDFRFFYSEIALGFAPETEVEHFEDFVRRLTRKRIRFVDPRWNMEKMVAHLARSTGSLSPFEPEE